MLKFPTVEILSYFCRLGTRRIYGSGIEHKEGVEDGKGEQALLSGAQVVSLQADNRWSGLNLLGLAPRRKALSPILFIHEASIKL
jgi:hypothetical protein